MHGKFVLHPVNGRRIPIICDAELVDMNFGTGAVKVRALEGPPRNHRSALPPSLCSLRFSALARAPSRCAR